MSLSRQFCLSRDSRTYSIVYHQCFRLGIKRNSRHSSASACTAVHDDDIMVDIIIYGVQVLKKC